ncbi:hypothetical protein L0156_08125 [bacterium]|nr:hypothetical protein [bacterium]MCI0602967.1 hypothetical protein [bacterium]
MKTSCRELIGRGAIIWGFFHGPLLTIHHAFACSNDPCFLILLVVFVPAERTALIYFKF